MQKITPSEALVETLRMHDVKYVSVKYIFAINIKKYISFFCSY